MPIINNVVIISNSIPKSGSTYLFNLQRSLIEGIIGKSIDYTPLEKFGIEVIGGFIHAESDDDLADFLHSEPELETPLLLKTHTSISDNLAEEFAANDRIFISLAVRNPVDIFQSARRNFFRTGEFSEFANVESGLALLNGFYRSIYERTIDVSQRKLIPIIRYEEIRDNPISALSHSFPLELKELLFENIARKYTDMDQVRSLSAHRLSTKIDQQAGQTSPDELELLQRSTQELREHLGY